MQEGMELLPKGQSLLQTPAPLHIGSFVWMTSRATSTPLRWWCSLCLGWWISMARWMSKGTACQFMCWQSQWGVPFTHICCANCYIWGVAPRFLPSAKLSEELECAPTMIPAKVIIVRVTPANWVPPVTPMKTYGESAYDPQKAKGWIIDELDLQRLYDWLEKEWRQARELLVKLEHLFTHNYLDLGKMSLIKHCIISAWLTGHLTKSATAGYPAYV